MPALFKFTAAALVALTLTGCAGKNYDFTATPTGPERIAELVDALEVNHTENGDHDDALYDLSVCPLLHSRLHVFAEAQEPDSPVAYVEAELDATLPLFGFLNATVHQYDADQALLVQHEFESGLWGAFRHHREVVTTPAGHRAKNRRTFFWLFTTCGDEQWQPTDTLAAMPRNPHIEPQTATK